LDCVCHNFESLARDLQGNAKNYITPAGYARLKAELKQLVEAERPEVVKSVTWAAALGDRSENADYLYGKRRLREIDRRVRFLIKHLEAAQVVESSGRQSGQVFFGACVKPDQAPGGGASRRIVRQAVRPGILRRVRQGEDRE